MSLKIKQLRVRKHLTQSDLADKLGVDIKTIRNWEKRNGKVPSILRMKELASVYSVPTYEVFSAFMSSPDVIESESDNLWHSHRPSFEEETAPYSLFKYIHEYKLFGEGLVIYRYKLFRYCILCEHELPLRDPENPTFDDIIYQSIYPSDGFILIDEAYNSIVITKKTIISWKKISEDNVHTVFEIKTNVAIFPEMEGEVKEKGFCSFYLDAYKPLSDQYLPYVKPEPLYLQDGENNVLGKCIKKVRERYNLTQEQFADELSVLSVRAKKTTVNRWESGSLIPSAYDLCMISIRFKINLELLLNAYDINTYVSSVIEENDRCYDLGIHHLFNNISDYVSFLRFLNHYSFFNLTMKNDKPFLLGSIVYNENETELLSIKHSNDNIIFELRNGESVVANRENLVCVIPYNLHLSLHYEIHFTLGTESENMEYSLGLAYSMRIPKDD